MTDAMVPEHSLVHSRFTDLRDEPMRFLSPIKGYENMPLVPLEVAVKSISHLFDSIEEYAWIAKENCKNPADGLTQDESASIHLYTMEFQPGPSLYLQLNAALRSEERANLMEWFLFLKLFLTAAHKLPSYSGKVWRGIKDVDMSSQFKRGEKIAWWGVSSCTQSVELLESEQFLGKHGVRTVFSITCINGKKIAAHSYFHDQEEEVILMPGSYFDVKGSLNPSPGFHMIDMEQIPPPITFVALPIQSTSVIKVPVNPPVNQITLNDNFNPNKIVSEIPAVVPDSKPIAQSTGTNVQSVLYSNEPTQTEISIQVPFSTSQTYSKSDDIIYQQKWNRKLKIAIIILICLTFFPIATLIMGQVHKNDCPIQTWIPLWMTFFGTVGLATFSALIFISLIIILCCSRDHRSIEYGIGGCILCLLLFFFLAWLIAGSIWLFPINKRVQFNETILENYCSETLYKFTFGTLLAQYALIGLMVCVGGCLACFC